MWLAAQESTLRSTLHDTRYTNMKYLIANWKAHKTLNDVEEWIKVFKEKLSRDHNKTTIILAASAPHLFLLKKEIEGLAQVYCAAQSVSDEPVGSFTGEVTAKALEGLVQYCIVGHSERRARGEKKEHIDAQIANLEASNIAPILCIRSVEDFPAGYSGIVAYEQPDAIGTGKNTEVNKVMEVYKKLDLSEGSTFLYGASVDENNCLEYLEHPEIKGFIVGTASLDPTQFNKIVEKI